MPTTALYHWSVAGCPVNVLIELSLVDRLRVAALANDKEIGGLLIGSFDGNYTIISDFEAIESEHRRGVGYQLSTRDERKVASRIEAWSHRKQGEVVGAFRSHRRPGMYLDESDNGLLSSYFRNSQQIALLVKPEPNGTATGGFFFWEDGEVNRKQTYLPFPMDAKQLEEGDFPLVEPVNHNGTGAGSAVAADVPLVNSMDSWSPAQPAIPFEITDAADTIDDLPGPAVLKYPDPEEASRSVPAGARRAVLPTPPPAATPHPSSNRLAWPAVGMIVALAVVGGYVIGTSSSHGDRFGARAGDISVSSAPPEAVPAPAPPVQQQKPAFDPAPVTPSEPLIPAEAKPALAAKPAPKATPQIAPVQPRKAVTSVLAYSPNPAPPATAPAAAPQPETPVPATTAANEPPTRPPGFAWSHYATPAASIPAPRPESGVESAVSVETVESGSIKRVARHIPLLGSMGGTYQGGDDFSPPQVIHSFAPKVPPQLAHSLSGPLPIDLRLKLDKTGKVKSVELISKQKSPEFTELAGGAAYRWQFEPAHMKDKNVPSEVIAHFRFKPAQSAE